MSSKEQIADFLDSILYYKGRGFNNGIWTSWEEICDEGSEPFCDFTEPHSWRTFGAIQLWYYINEYPDLFKGHEVKIEFRIHGQWDTVFEGWVDTADELKIICKCVGIPFDIKTNDT